MPKVNNKTKKRPFSAGTVIVLALILVISILGGAFAKYIHDANGRNLISAKEFYFTSDLLKETAEKYVLSSTSTEISFTLGNNADDLRFSQTDIEYTVTVTTKNGGALPTISYSDSSGVLSGGSVSKVNVTLSGLQKGEVYTVTAEGTAGYRQTLKAEFTVSDKDVKIYKNLNTSNASYVLLTVWTGNVSGTLNVNVPAGLIPDNTDPIQKSVKNLTNSGYAAFSFTDSENYQLPYSSYTYRFFKESGSAVSVENFTVTINDTTATYEAETAGIPK